MFCFLFLQMMMLLLGKFPSAADMFANSLV